MVYMQPVYINSELGYESDPAQIVGLYYMGERATHMDDSGVSLEHKYLS